MTAGFLLGTRAFYQWAAQHPMIELFPTEYINDPYVIAQNDRMVAINSALEIDLSGQVCADSIGPVIYSGVGGQMDFISGAARSKGGIPIIALGSTALLKDGRKVSRIVPLLRQGAGVTITRNHVHFVVTEFGKVNLYGKSIRERSRLLISIADPDCRDDFNIPGKTIELSLIGNYEIKNINKIL